MAGIWFSPNNVTGHLASFAYEDGDNEGFNDYLTQRLHFHATLYLDSAATATSSVPVLTIQAGPSKTELTARTLIFVDSGILTFQYYDNNGNFQYQSVTNDPIPLDALVEVTIAVNGTATYSWDQMKMYVNGTEQTTDNSYFPANTIKPFQKASKLFLGGEVESPGAKGLLLLNTTISNEWRKSAEPAPLSSTSWDTTVWHSDFEDSANPLKVDIYHNNTYTIDWINTDSSNIVWTEGNEPPAADTGGGSGGIIIPGNGNITQVQGSVTENDLPVARRVIAITEVQLDVTDSDQKKHAVLDSVISDASDGSYTLNTSPYEGAVMVVAMDNYGSLWQGDTAYQVGDVIRPSTFQGYVYICTLAGTTDSTEPVWWLDTETTQTVGTAQFQAKPFSRPLAHGPIIPTILPSE